MAKVSPKSRPATSAPKTPQGQRQTSFKKTTLRRSDTAPDMPHEQERGETKRHPGMRNIKRRRATVDGRNLQQEKKGKMHPAVADVYESSRDDASASGTTKPIARGKLARRPRTGKSAKKGSRRSRSPSTRKNTRSKATGTRRRQQGKKSGTRATTSLM